ncbi:T9SS type A sorting domain-containing protein [Pontibacter sp. G13]|uniref:T9SS type A sorting domain-containing protein n=1 Tax=Pontibacter sp. G13 TaxID=3074898 RepID=UPI002889C151|nr:T9SS type A sorting domain-containing protein [Pontibacter sp. G13]WNJ19940.1 T9SS type A sorting domain-containing protein [Pontibacter sp. G13]
MKTQILSLLLVFAGMPAFSQINARLCPNFYSGATESLVQDGTVVDGAITRYSYKTSTGSYLWEHWGLGGAGSGFEALIQWSTANSRWEVLGDGDATPNPPDYESLLYSNSSASYPYPPDLTLGTWTDQIGGCGSITVLSGDVQGSLVVPVTWAGIQADVQAYTVQIAWSTHSESNNHHFEVERKIGRGEFQTIGSVDGAGNSASQKSYEFVDHLPVSGLQAYRVKQVDIDGAFSYSEVVEASLGDAIQDFDVYPNPTDHELILRMRNPQAADIQVFSPTGKLVMSETIQPDMSGLKVWEIGDWEAGLYLIRVQTGETFKTVKLMVH